MKPLLLFLSFSFVFGHTLHAEMREWTSSADPSKKIKGDLQRVRGDVVFMKMENGRVMQFPLSKLSKADQEYAKSINDPSKPPKAKVEIGPGSPPAEVIELFVFQESSDEVYVRLKEHKGLLGGVNEILRGRTGLNGMYFIKPEGVRYPLFFEFKDKGGLVEASLQSDGFTKKQFGDELMKSWGGVRTSLLAKYGAPVFSAGYPNASTLTDGLSLSTDVWKTPKGEVYLGIGNVDGSFSCVVKIRKSGFLR